MGKNSLSGLTCLLLHLKPNVLRVRALLSSFFFLTKPHLSTFFFPLKAPLFQMVSKTQGFYFVFPFPLAWLTRSAPLICFRSLPCKSFLTLFTSCCHF